MPTDSIFDVSYEANAQRRGELFHYTTADGLKGIVTDKALWATRSDFLNDREEREGFLKVRLPILAQQVVDMHLPGTPFPERQAAVQQLVKQLSEMVRTDDHPYVISLCNAAADDAEHGLLSQWRGYGTDGGYAVVFDAEMLIQILKRERFRYDYTLLDMDEVAYHANDGSVRSAHDRIKRYEQTVMESLSLSGVGPENLVYKAFTLVSNLYKNRGFREEDEVRIIAVPQSARSRFMMALALRKKEKDFLTRKPIKYRTKDGLLFPYLELELTNEDSPSLPIKRVLVGPHPDADRRVRAVDALLQEYGIDARVQKSGIPFVR